MKGCTTLRLQQTLIYPLMSSFVEICVTVQKEASYTQTDNYANLIV